MRKTPWKRALGGVLGVLGLAVLSASVAMFLHQMSLPWPLRWSWPHGPYPWEGMKQWMERKNREERESMPQLTDMARIALQATPGVHERVIVVEVRNGLPPVPRAAVLPPEEQESEEQEPEEEGPTEPWIEPARLPQDMVTKYLDGIGAGLFGGPAEGARGEVLRTEDWRDGDATWRTWEMRLPALPPDALLPLIRMLAFTTSIEVIRITEKASAETATLRTIESLGKARRFEPPWGIGENLDFHREYDVNAKDSAVEVTFKAGPPPDLVRATHAVLRTWGELVCAGAFGETDGWPISSGVLGEPGRFTDRDVLVAFDFLNCGRDGWDALFRGLVRIHRAAPIASLEVHT